MKSPSSIGTIVKFILQNEETIENCSYLKDLLKHLGEHVTDVAGFRTSKGEIIYMNLAGLAARSSLQGKTQFLNCILELAPGLLCEDFRPKDCLIGAPKATPSPIHTPLVSPIAVAVQSRNYKLLNTILTSPSFLINKQQNSLFNLQHILTNYMDILPSFKANNETEMNILNSLWAQAVEVISIDRGNNNKPFIELLDNYLIKINIEHYTNQDVDSYVLKASKINLLKVIFTMNNKEEYDSCISQ